MAQKISKIPASIPVYSAEEVDDRLAAKVTYFTGTKVMIVDEERMETDAEVIARRTTGLTVKIGTLFVVETPQEDAESLYTAYRYAPNAEGVPEWQPLKGNYSADNIMFDSDLIFTADIGVKKVGASGSGTISAAGRTVAQVLKSILAQEKYPKTPTAASATIEITNSGSFECGTKVTPAWKATFSKGSYEFGPDTGIQSVESVVYHGTAEDEDAVTVEANTLNGKTGTFAEVTLGATDVIKAKLNWGSTASSATPVTNMGNDATQDIEDCEGTKVTKLAAQSGKTVTSSKSISGYRMGRFFGTTSTLVDEESIDSAVIRALAGKSNNGTVTGSFSFTVKSGARCIVIAVAGNKTLSKVLNTTVNADMTSSFVKCSELIQVAGADAPSMDNAAGYSVWIYTPAEAYGSDADLTVTIA